MNDDPSLAAIVASRLGGAVAGAFLALVFIPPKTMREFLSRCAASVIAGAIFTHPIRSFLGWPNDIENVLAAACIAGFVCWPVMGWVTRAIAAKTDLSKP